MFDSFLRHAKEILFLYLCAPFENVNPNLITVVSGLFGLGCVGFAARRNESMALVMWVLNRVFDGLDGSVARKFGKQSNFGGYLDILVDFTVYGLIPVGIVYGNPSDSKWLILSLLLVTYFVNSAGLFYLSAIIEKNNAQITKEFTSITMPVGFIEGFETIVFYSMFLVFPDYVELLFIVFGIGVVITILQRLHFASKLKFKDL